MKTITFGFMLIFAFGFQPTLTAQNAESGGKTFQTNRTIGITSVGVAPARLFSLRALALLVPLTDNLELHLAASYADENIGDNFVFVDLGEDLMFFPAGNAAVIFRAAAFYDTPEVSGFTTRLGVMGDMVFVVPGAPGIGESVSRMSFGSGIQEVGPACGFTWSFHRRVRLAAYYWLHYYRVVKPEVFEHPSGFNREYEKYSGNSTAVLLELAIKPF